ncbi:heavy metal-associated domain-containing protein [Nitrosomonas communis]|uniref:heavy-metal-associated domain-containing protein n=1 Tax=Nitrosomonas communis TaxID=44574 RepID=UPI0026EFE11D|nr:heavy metal-associated domain-containing protein [Nitrosomonas communis]MCO6427854.1 heavy-metal-associated domain-containing protein [Nitrosomonas communis]
MQTTIINIKGMTCMGCVRSVKNVVEKISGVGSVEVSLENAQVTIQFDAAIACVDQFRQAIEDAGFEAII